MRIRKALSVVMAAAALSACGEIQDDSIETKTGAIIRPTSLGGRNEVVMLYSVIATPQGIFNRTCTGSYYAPRVVMTAAHCLTDIINADSLLTRPQLFIYWGDNFAVDKAELTQQGVTFIPPPIGSPSHFAQADSFQIHPNWDPNLIYPDMGVIFLDRKPPFDPLPFFRNRVAANLQVTITGWGANSAPTPTTGAGAQVQRTGRSRTLGSPTIADYHPEDPNPGMLDPVVRNNTMKLDGRAPNSNGCFGDSGGPFIINQFGQDYFAGVGSFTGLSCEDYSLYVRLDPFLPFLDNSYKRGGQDVLKPTFQCVTPNAQGTLTAHFGYRNDNGVVVTIPYGSKNSAPRDTFGTRPTAFFPGAAHNFSAAIDFPSGQSAVWTLSPDNNPTTTLTATSTSPRCTSAVQMQTEAALGCRAIRRSGCPQFGTYAECSEQNGDFNQFVKDFIPECVPAQTAFWNCLANAAPGSPTWDCDAGLPPACFDELDAYFGCLG